MMRLQTGSGAFLAFVAALFFVYWACSWSRPLRLAIVLLANYLFCARFGLFYLLLIPACSTADFLIGLGLMRARGAAGRRILLAVSVTINLALPVAGRYMGLFLNHRHPDPVWDWIFPLGLSFYAFQSLTYTIDLYRRDAEGTHSLLAYLSAVSFFPTMQSGPITRVTELVKQFGSRPALSRVEGGRAFFLIGLGLLKKTLIANYLADNLVNRVFDTPKLYSGAETLVAIYGYSLQLYYDFSGYTDIARGTALLLGIRLPVNFDRPYLAAGVPEFWRRWHISFSSWLRDYLYFSLPGARTRVMPYVNLVITMLLGGLWHGISWTFASWGLLHGGALAAARAWRTHRGTSRPLHPLARAAAIFGTYQFVCLTWVFFRASNMANALDILGCVASMTPGLGNISVKLAAALLAGLLALFATRRQYNRAMEAFAACPFYVHAAALLALAAVLQYLGGRGAAPFVYSRF